MIVRLEVGHTSVALRVALALVEVFLEADWRFVAYIYAVNEEL